MVPAMARAIQRGCEGGAHPSTETGDAARRADRPWRLLPRAG